MIEIPEYFKKKVHRGFGEVGAQWLARLPELTEQCVRRWDLTMSGPVEDLSVNYVTVVLQQDGIPAILKIGVPHPELWTEMDSLPLYQKDRIVRCIAVDRELGAILLERIQPGHELTTLRDNRKETEIAAGIMKTLPARVPETHSFPTYTGWVRNAVRKTREETDSEGRWMPARYLDLLESLMKDVERTKEREVLLHGDLHHENILLDEKRGWVAIDPKGVVGDPCLDAGRFIQNQIPLGMPLTDRESLLEERIGIISAVLGYERERVLTCSIIDFILSHCWNLEDRSISEEWQDQMLTLELLCKMGKYS